MPFELHFLKPSQALSAKRPKKMSAAFLVSGFLFVLAASFLIYVPQEKVITNHPVNLGDIVNEDIKITKDITIEDKEGTEARKKKALEEVVPVYEYYEESQTNARDLITQWFQVITEARKEYIKSNKAKPVLIAIKNRIEKEFGLEFDNEKELQTLLNTNFFHQADLNKLLEMVNGFYEKKILESTLGAKPGKKGTIKAVLKTGEPAILKIQDLYDRKKVKASLILFIEQQGFALGPVELIASTLMNFIGENIFYSQTLTQEAEQRAAANVNPVLIKLKAGKVIIRKGDEVTPNQMKILKLIAAQTQIRKPQLSSFYLILVILGFLTLFGRKFFKTWATGGINKDKLYVITGATLLVSAVIYRVAHFIFTAILTNITLDIPYEAQSIYYAIPFGVGVLVIAFIFDLQGAVIFTFVNALVGGMFCNWDMRIYIYILLTGLAVSYGVEFYQRVKRSSIIKAGVLWMLPISLVAIIVFHLTESRFNLELLTVNAAAGIFSALVCPILAHFIISLWEVLFQLVTELKLIELTNLNLPVFREMLEKAPGTYHHSQMVASLAESAARDLGLSPLLQTALALYHDIGKIDNPHFFSENHSVYKNPHDHLLPRDSAKNIIAHIPDGLERALKAKLPPLIGTSILQHHGTKVVRFFYDKAREMSSIDSDGLDDKVFRYPGQKPQNIENAIIMLADQVEAASKSLSAPTDEEIKNVIRKIIDANSQENQFDECEGLTIKNLNIIANSFLKKLSSIYHMRVSYPGFDFKENKENNNHKTKTGNTGQFKVAV